MFVFFSPCSYLDVLCLTPAHLPASYQGTLRFFSSLTRYQPHFNTSLITDPLGLKRIPHIFLRATGRWSWQELVGEVSWGQNLIKTYHGDRRQPSEREMLRGSQSLPLEDGSNLDGIGRSVKSSGPWGSVELLTDVGGISVGMEDRDKWREEEESGEA